MAISGHAVLLKPWVLAAWVDGSADALVGRATAQVAGHGAVDVGIGGAGWWPAGATALMIWPDWQ